MLFELIGLRYAQTIRSVRDDLSNESEKGLPSGRWWANIDDLEADYGSLCVFFIYLFKQGWESYNLCLDGIRTGGTLIVYDENEITQIMSGLRSVFAAYASHTR